MVTWMIEARETEADEWEIVDGGFEVEMARTMQALVEEDGFVARARELRDLPQEEREKLLERSDARTVEDLDRLEDYRVRAAARLHGEGR